MTAHDELWSGTALDELRTLPAAVRDQVEATVRQVCADPGGVGRAVPGEEERRRPLYLARAGLVAVLYEIDTIGEMVHILRVVNRS